MGANTAANKSQNFTNSDKTREERKMRKWSLLGLQIPVEDAFRYLGAHVNVSKKRITKVIDDRIKRPANMTRILTRLQLSMKTRTNTIRTNILPLAMHGTHPHPPPPPSLLLLSPY